jgi:hypothetical protein
MDHDNGLTYNLTYCLSYIMDHDNGLTYNLTCCLGYIMDHDNGLTYNLSYWGKTVAMIHNVTQTTC